jgi:hypothetical protein
MRMLKLTDGRLELAADPQADLYSLSVQTTDAALTVMLPKVDMPKVSKKLRLLADVAMNRMMENLAITDQPIRCSAGRTQIALWVNESQNRKGSIFQSIQLGTNIDGTWDNVSVSVSEAFDLADALDLISAKLGIKTGVLQEVEV